MINSLERCFSLLCNEQSVVFESERDIAVYLFMMVGERVPTSRVVSNAFKSGDTQESYQVQLKKYIYIYQPKDGITTLAHCHLLVPNT